MTAGQPRPAGRPKVLTLIGALWPGNDSSGPNQSYRAMCESLSEEFDFAFLARDRAFGAADAAADRGGWTDLGFARGRYCSVGRFGAHGLGTLLRETPHDLLVLNGFFDREFTIPTLLLRRTGLVPRRSTLLSPRGEFAAGALSLKTPSKRAYLELSRSAGLLRDVWLHATGPQEAIDIGRGCGWAKGILEAPNVRQLPPVPPGAARPTRDGALRVAFVGRVSPVKNLDFALEALGHVRSPVDFFIHGPIGDADHWSQCAAIAARLPGNVRVHGPVEIPNAEVPGVLASMDLLFLPTRGENFGHAIFEALACSLPVLISDQTPWLDLEQSDAGWSLPLANPEEFAARIDGLSRLSPEARKALRTGARRRAERWVSEGDAVARTRRMLWAAMGKPL